MNWAQIRTLVMFKQTVFGLPWALIGALFPFIDGNYHQPLNQWRTWCLILVAFTLARTSGMAFNRLIDRHIDARNPRTQHRPLQTGKVTVFQVTLLAVGCLIGFIICCWLINPLCFALSFIPAALLVFYSFTKRFTAFCHLVLGLVEFFAPLMAWIAIKGTVDWPPILLGIAMCLWLTGMDIFYSLQDVCFDRQWRLRSAPVALGIKPAIVLAKVLHGLCVLVLIVTGLLVQASMIYYIGIFIVASIFSYQHKMICPQNTHRIEKTFFVCNGWIAFCLLAFTAGEVIWRVLS
ncbi:MAG: UbiA family prenyltransferase [Parachlamydiales bacterium]|nr:UbiA family prenyltransferase [Parachlamydiales bacterium]